MMGGHGDLSKVFSDYPKFDKPPYFDFYYIFITGYHIESLFTHSLGKKNTDYMEMIFHHVLTLNLIFFSYLSCFTKVGILILWLHLWVDNFTSIARAWGNINNTLAFLSYCGIMIMWVYSRLYIFAFIIKEIYFTETQIYGVDISVRDTFWYLNMSFILLLYCLHVFWFFLFCKLGYNLIFLNLYEDAVSSPIEKSKKSKDN